VVEIVGGIVDGAARVLSSRSARTSASDRRTEDSTEGETNIHPARGSEEVEPRAPSVEESVVREGVQVRSGIDVLGLDEKRGGEEA